MGGRSCARGFGGAASRGRRGVGATASAVDDARACANRADGDRAARPEPPRPELPSQPEPLRPEPLSRPELPSQPEPPSRTMRPPSAAAPDSRPALALREPSPLRSAPSAMANSSAPPPHQPAPASQERTPAAPPSKPVNLFAASALATAADIQLAPTAADRAWRPRHGVGGDGAAGGVDVGSFLAEDAARLRVEKGAVAPPVAHRRAPPRHALLADVRPIGYFESRRATVEAVSRFLARPAQDGRAAARHRSDARDARGEDAIAAARSRLLSRPPRRGLRPPARGRRHRRDGAAQSVRLSRRSTTPRSRPSRRRSAASPPGARATARCARCGSSTRPPTSSSRPTRSWSSTNRPASASGAIRCKSVSITTFASWPSTERAALPVRRDASFKAGGRI